MVLMPNLLEGFVFFAICFPSPPLPGKGETFLVACDSSSPYVFALVFFFCSSWKMRREIGTVEGMEIFQFLVFFFRLHCLVQAKRACAKCCFCCRGSAAVFSAQNFHSRLFSSQSSRYIQRESLYKWAKQKKNLGLGPLKSNMLTYLRQLRRLSNDSNANLLWPVGRCITRPKL